MNGAIIVAAGKSTRAGQNVDKAFLSLGGKPVVIFSLLNFEKCPDIDEIILVVRKNHIDAARGAIRMFSCNKVKKVVSGGNRRQDSVLNGLNELSDEVDIVSVHDGARPCVTPELISGTIKSAKRYGSGIAATKVTDTIKEAVRGLTIDRTIDRTKLWAVQTPQTFKKDLLLKAYKAVKKKRTKITDEASALELLGEKVRLVKADAGNIKITAPEDIALATALLHI
jgi:2-C-methyl-D-erythritol 4-phosphate cytidylyltransferase